MGPELQVSANVVDNPSVFDRFRGPAASSSDPSFTQPNSSAVPISASLRDPAVVDEWLALEAELVPLAPKFTRQAELRARILSWITDLPEDQGTTVEGTQANIWITVRDNKRKITDAGKRGLQKIWGLRLFRQNASFTLSQLPDPKDLQGVFTAQERSGPRHLKVVPKWKPAA